METTGGAAASGEAMAVAAVGVVDVVVEGVDAPVAVAVEWEEESYSLPAAVRFMIVVSFVDGTESREKGGFCYRRTCFAFLREEESKE